MSAEKIFLFNNGGKKESGGEIGNWDVILDQNGQISISQAIGNEVGFSGMFKVTTEENLKLWELVEALNLRDFIMEDDLAGADKKLYTFNLKIAENEVNREVPINIAKKNSKINELLGYLKEIIPKYSDHNLAL